jgi:hypothetical protein
MYCGTGRPTGFAGETAPPFEEPPLPESEPTSISHLPVGFTPWWKQAVLGSEAAQPSFREIDLSRSAFQEPDRWETIGISYWQLYLARARWAIARQHYLRGRYLFQNEEQTSFVAGEGQSPTCREEVAKRCRMLPRYRQAIETIEARFGPSAQPDHSLSPQGQLLPLEEPVFTAPKQSLWESKRLALAHRPEIRLAAEELDVHAKTQGISGEQWISFLDRFLQVASTRADELVAPHELPDSLHGVVQIIQGVMGEVESAVTRQQEAHRTMCRAYTTLSRRREEIESLHRGNEAKEIPLETMLEAQEQLMRAEMKFAASIAEYNFSLLQMRRALGIEGGVLRIGIVSEPPSLEGSEPRPSLDAARTSFPPPGESEEIAATDVVVGPYSSVCPTPNDAFPRMASVPPNGQQAEEEGKNTVPARSGGYVLQSSNDFPANHPTSENGHAEPHFSGTGHQSFTPVGVKDAVVEIPLPAKRSHDTIQ